jgi:hypothetical protein
MRTTTVILILTIAVGAGMYLLLFQKPESNKYDTISVVNTPDSVIQKLKVFVADQPIELIYRDSAWFLPDSTPLKRVLDGTLTDTMSFSLPQKTLIVSYDDRFFYDMDIVKSDSSDPNKIELRLQPRGDTMVVSGKIDKSEKGVINFASPMANMYRSFMITYTTRMPDSLRLANIDSTSPQSKATKIITVISP